MDVLIGRESRNNYDLAGNSIKYNQNDVFFLLTILGQALSMTRFAHKNQKFHAHLTHKFLLCDWKNMQKCNLKQEVVVDVELFVWVNKKYSTKIASALQHSTAALNKCIILKIEQNYVLCVHFGLKLQITLQQAQLKSSFSRKKNSYHCNLIIIRFVLTFLCWSKLLFVM